MSSWTPEELHAHALKQPGADAPNRAADLAMWVWQLTADDQPRLQQQQPQSQHQQESQSQRQEQPQLQRQQGHVEVQRVHN